ncbi:phage head-binding domain-containing protein [Yersinia bercovieri]|uniref:phage head-binding domain-containing protein n=1 Tax=Yersinia bercovieri TaxID=634 RepID=UPI0021BD266E|nr:phage head-binding domain-containing protein [Yersinia bercovieri]
MPDIIPNVVVSMPSQLFTMPRKFGAVFGGRIYIGLIDTDPTIPSNQIQVYLENEDGSLVPVAQPLLINAGGYPVYNGQIAKFVTVQGHSMAVYDALNVQQFYFPNILKYDPDQLRQEITAPGGDKIVGSSYGGNVFSDYSPSIYRKKGSFGTGITLTSSRSVVKYTDGFHYAYKGTFPHVNSESSPDANYINLGLLDGWPVNTPQNYGAKADGITDDSAAFQKVINVNPYGDIHLPYSQAGYCIKTVVTIPMSASFRLMGVGGTQSSYQALILCQVNGPAFYSSSANTVFTQFHNIKFSSNYDTYPNSQAIVHDGAVVHAAFINLTCTHFGKVAIETKQATNVSKFSKLLFMFNKDYGLVTKFSVSNIYEIITIDNNFGGGIDVSGATCTFTNLYSEDSCKRNVTDSTTFREFKFSGTGMIFNGISINSFAGNATPPIDMTFCIRSTLIGVTQLTPGTPSYPFEIENGGGLPEHQETGFVMIECAGIRLRYPNGNNIDIGTAYLPGKGVRIKANGLDIARKVLVAFNGVQGIGLVPDNAIYGRFGVLSVERTGVGQYRINFSLDMGYEAALVVSGTASSETDGLSVLSVRGHTSSYVLVRTFLNGTAFDSQRVNVSIETTPQS